MTRFPASVERAWLLVYTAGLPPQESDDRRAEVRSDQWEYEHYCLGNGEHGAERFQRLAGGVADDIAWRVSLGRNGLSKARLHEAIMLLAVAGVFLFSLPASVWWAIALAGDLAQPALQIWYLGSAAISLGCAVVGGAALAAYYPRVGRTLMLVGITGFAATLWWAPVVALILAISGVATVFALPDRIRAD